MPAVAFLGAELFSDAVRTQRQWLFVSAGHLLVAVPTGATCASACFLIFAAGAKRVVAPDALIGVHSTSIGGQETPETLAANMEMARDAAALGVPPEIVGKMVETKPAHMEWLTPEELATCGAGEARPQHARGPSAPPRTVQPLMLSGLGMIA